MRVIAGTRRSIKLKTLEGMEVRPTLDQTKETLFNVLQPIIYDARFLDLYSGSGGIGIEAMSRGAKECVMVEQNPKVIKVIKENLGHTKFDDFANLMQCDVFSAISRLSVQKKKFDIIFLDPPFNKGLEIETLKALSEASIMEEDATIVVECSNLTDLSKASDFGFEMIKEKRYSSNRHVFFKLTTQK
ncbi:MAG: 16S rRNA (guanine(966)-N(2))-methyltransferase RsmD [Lachnospiraceae bacterium]|nr:16S rRNA (guanine(966)-N(2))-methyltransferase RsmD [Lachnospiraceae bacterium]